MEKINSDGRYYAISCSLDSLRDTVNRFEAMDVVAEQIIGGLGDSSVSKIRELFSEFDDRSYMSKPSIKVRYLLKDLCSSLDRELVVFFDEADCLFEGPLIMFLSQIRNGYLQRSASPENRFPRSLALVGMRDIRDYRNKVRPETESSGLASPFNVIMESFTLSNFTMDEIKSLYGQHTAETGQVFDSDAVDRAWYWTEGQPWLVNALANNVIIKQFRNDYTRVITGADVDLAVQDLILRNPTHFDSLLERLKEPRVRRVMEAVLIGTNSIPSGVLGGDFLYAVDLGLLKDDSGDEKIFRPSNPVYREIIVRALTNSVALRDSLPDDLPNKWMDGKILDMTGLLKDFQKYWRENSQTTANKYAIETFLRSSIDQAFKNFNIDNKNELHDAIINNITCDLTGLANEAFAHIVLFAFLQRVLNGGADSIQREYALGTTKVDIYVRYKDIGYPLELKIKGAMSRGKSYEQLTGYMDKCGASVGWLVIFDMNFQKPWDKKLFWETVDCAGKTIHVVGC
jgi:hypothetical protein